MPDGRWIDGGSIRASVLMFVAGLALASGALQILHVEPTRPYERLGKIVMNEDAGTIGVGIHYQQ